MILQIVDPDDLTTILFDFLSDDGTNNARYAGGVITKFGTGYAFNLGAATESQDEFNPSSSDGGSIISQRATLTDFDWQQRIIALSYDQLYAGISWLNVLLRNGCVMKYQAEGSAFTKYIDVEPSQAPALLDGRPMGLYQVMKQFQTGEGTLMKLRRQPFLRSIELDPHINKLLNGTLLYVDGSGVPQAWSIISGTTSTPIANDDSLEITGDVATGIGGSIKQTITGVAAGEVWTASMWGRPVDAVDWRIRIEFLDGSNVVLATFNSSPFTEGVMTRHSLTATAPSTTAKIQLTVRLNQSSSHQKIRVFGAQLEKAAAMSDFRVGVETIANNPETYPGRRMAIWAPGDAPALIRCLRSPLSSSIFGAMGFAYAGNRKGLPGKSRLADWLNKAAFTQMEGWALDTDASNVADATASAGNMKRIDFSTPTMTIRAHKIISDADALAALQGKKWRFRLRAASNGSGTVVNIVVKWYWGSDALTTSAVALDPVKFTSGAAGSWADVDLGLAVFPDTIADALQVDIWAERTSVSGSLDMDIFAIAPADGQVCVYELGGNIGIGETLRTSPLKNIVDVIDSSTLQTTRGRDAIKVSGPVAGIIPPGVNVMWLDHPLSNNSLAYTEELGVYVTPRWLG